MARVSVIHEVLNACLGYHGFQIRPVLITTYQSRTKHGNGTPFYTVGFIVSKEEKTWATVEKILTQHATFSRQFMRMFSLLKGEEETSVRRIAIELVGSGMYSCEEAAKVLDIKPMTIAAWKAHETMGSYDDENRSEYMNITTHRIGKYEEQSDGTFVTPIDSANEAPLISQIREEEGWGSEIELECVSAPGREEAFGWGLPTAVATIRVKGSEA
tara:strand:- start:87 stop:731 length:645 start_codon:yes stop_codon:yes gene_type:complete